MELRPYQSELYNSIRGELSHGHKSVCAVLGCGGGKSCIEAAIAKSAVDKGNRVLFIVHRTELCEQIQRTFDCWGVDRDMCQIAMVQTVTRHIDRIDKPKLIITDECHHCLAKSYTDIYDAFSDSPRLGFTATPLRMKEGGLGRVFDSLVEGVSTKWLIENNYLAPYRYIAPTLANADGLHVKRGDYDSAELAALMQNRRIYGDTVEHYRKFADGKQTIAYCASIEASMCTAEAFKSAGIVAVHLDGETPKQAREEAVEAFRRGEIRVLCNVDLFGEGFDVPDCECVTLLRPTKSLTLFIQQSMRSMRYKPDKTAMIIDHVRNVFMHGFPDTPHEWTLDENIKKAKKKDGDVNVIQCPECFAVMSFDEEVCPVCGFEFPKKKRKELTVDEDYELTEITEANIDITKYSDYKKCKTFKELLEFRKKRNYKLAWAAFKAVELGIEIPPRYRESAERAMNGAIARAGATEHDSAGAEQVRMDYVSH